ncbi:hypothetical protein CEUSTIGMA_g207.t1 [Chlamydomonas eustigma]|uniref:Glycosyltransferase family 92 protein n=1 Tax=Chlamydomonas eustigma TaxID=1157962 RepID=A0A250WPN3_9CHLO|nr:hypothetical protein CEUSTIGMA_g207.t1 [Chlamydomonas eustigma]|eukprot:GAX72751.1 hypothetical protein CEUSTIGMA_g207.t1 [Chlamydomonas eustigma]
MHFRGQQSYFCLNLYNVAISFIVLWSALLPLCDANPGLLSAIEKDPKKLKMIVDGMGLDSLYINSGDMGIKPFKFSTMAANPIYPHSPKELHIRVTVFMRYMVGSNNLVTIKAFLTAETRDIARTPNDLYIMPTFCLTSTTSEQVHSFSIRAYVHSYWDPPAQSAMVYGFETSFTLMSNSSLHEPEWSLRCDLDSASYEWQPHRDLNLVDGRGINVPTITETDGKERETFVVLNPSHPNPAMFGSLIVRHVEYYQGLGVSKHIIYLRRETIPALILSSLKVHKLVQMGKIILVMWEDMLPHELWSKRYDQRVVYSHAVLAFTGLNVHLINIDLDEYLVTRKPELQGKPIQQIIQTCLGSDISEARILRSNILCKDCEHDRPESFLWGSAAAEQWPSRHPLSWYKLSSYGSSGLSRSIVNPNFMRAFYINWGAPISGHNTTQADVQCMAFLHVVHMFQASLPKSVISAQFTEDESWIGMLSSVKAMTL